MDPLSLAEMGARSFGNLFSGIMGYQAAKSQASAYRAAAVQDAREGGLDARLRIQQGDQVAAQAAVQTAANGGGFTGSSMGVINQLAAQAYTNGRQAAYRGVLQRRNDLYNAQVASANASNQLIGAAVGFASPIAGGMLQQSFRQSQLNSLSVLRGLGQASPYDYGMMY